jgi:hypothetical protein
MKPYSPETGKGRTVAGHDVHHKTADCGKTSANASAKRMRHAARQLHRKLAQSVED